MSEKLPDDIAGLIERLYDPNLMSERTTRYNAASTLKKLAQEVEKFKTAEHMLSAAYVRLRHIIPGALDTPHAPSPEQVWTITEQAAARLVDRVAELEAELDQIKLSRHILKMVD